jgi:hypothetical protein
MKIVRAPGKYFALTELEAEEYAVSMGKVRVTSMSNMERDNFKCFFFEVHWWSRTHEFGDTELGYTTSNHKMK